MRIDVARDLRWNGLSSDRWVAGVSARIAAVCGGGVGAVNVERP
jgi:hypothetical protein